MKKALKAIKKGFTLVELVIVIAVIAVLSAILIPAFGGIMTNAKVGSLNTSLKSLSSELLMEAQTEHISYFSPETARAKLLAKNIDKSSIPDGYTIWYDQQNWSYQVKKDVDVYSASTASLGSIDGVRKVEAADALSFDVEELPRRPEALDPSNKNALIMFTANTNLEKIYTGIYAIAEKAGTFTDSAKAKEGFNAAITAMTAELDAIMKEAQSNFPGDKYPSFGKLLTDEYKPAFDVNTTCYVTPQGYMFTGASVDGTEVKNIIFGRDSNTGNACETLQENILPGDKLPVFSVNIEIPISTKYIEVSTVASTLGTTSSLGNVTIITHAGVVANGTTTSTDYGSLNVIDSNRGVSRAAGNIEYLGGESIAKLVSYNYADSSYFYKTENGLVVEKTFADGTTAEAKAAWLKAAEKTADGKLIVAKYVAPMVNIAPGAFFNEIGWDEKVNELELLKYRVIEGADTRNAQIILQYSKMVNSERQFFGVSCTLSYGNITNLEDFINNLEEDYNPISTSSAKAGDFKVTLPNYKGFLNYYKAEGNKVEYDVKVTAYYEQSTKYYEQSKDNFGEFSYTYKETENSAQMSGEMKYNADKKGFVLDDDKMSFAPVNSGSHAGLCYKNIIKLNRVEVADKDGNILFVKLYV